jgi:hypothetical protein
MDWQCPCDQCNGRIEPPDYEPCGAVCIHGVCAANDGEEHICVNDADFNHHVCACGFEWTETKVAIS